MNTILIAYATKTDTTKDIAEFISGLLDNKGFKCDVIKIKKVKNISAYDKIIIGTGIRMSKPLPEAVEFIEQHKEQLNQKEVYLFSVGGYMKEDNDENRKKTLEFLKSVTSQINFKNIGLFAGRIVHKNLSMPWRTFAHFEKTGLLDEGNWVDWEKIQEWTKIITIK